MKKIISTTLAAIMLSGIAVPASAESYVPDNTQVQEQLTAYNAAAKAAYPAYDKVIKKFKKRCKNSKTELGGFSYCQIDINKDGKKELVIDAPKKKIRAASLDNHISYYYVYTIKKGKAKYIGKAIRRKVNVSASVHKKGKNYYLCEAHEAFRYVKKMYIKKGKFKTKTVLTVIPGESNENVYKKYKKYDKNPVKMKEYYKK